jgi:hypothetical protein
MPIACDMLAIVDPVRAVARPSAPAGKRRRKGVVNS